jgi:transglutaminase-like putative cysteine protease
MGRRLGQLAGLYALVLVLLRLTRLLQSGPDLPRWELILLASTLLGAVVWWLMAQASVRPAIAAIPFLLGAVVVFLRVAVPSTLTAGVIPTGETVPVLGDVMVTALRLIRSGVPPVYPEAGVLAILAVLMWVLGAAFAYGAANGQLVVMFVPAAIVYLQFAVFDRRPAGFLWMGLAAVGLALAITAVALERREHVGRARDASGRPKHHRSAAAAMATAAVVAVASVLTAGQAVGVVSEYGNVPWRTGLSGSGPGSGGVAFDRWVGLHQRLQSRGDILLFQATLDEGSPPGDQLYWRMESLDAFNGVEWRRGGSQIRNYEPRLPIGDEQHFYRGSTVDVLQRVFIAGLVGELVPVAGNAVALQDVDGADVIPSRSFRVGRDATLYYPQGLVEDANYQVESTFPLHEQDLGALATGEDGQLSPIFEAAAAAGLFDAEPRLVELEAGRPSDLESFTSLPDDLPLTLRAIAARQTRGATTDFERAWMLQWWFRDSGAFEYSTQVSTGHDALVLADWLDDPESPNFRTGYCEQFAASMAVLGRLLRIPSRVVWGFTPGTVTTTTDQSGDPIEVVQVRDTNAHAWVEMWMDGFGWVRFDPTPRGDFQPPSITAGFDPADYVPEQTPGEAANPVTPDLVDLPPGPVEGVGDPVIFEEGPRWGLLLLPAAALLVGLIPLLKRFRRRRRLRLVREGDITAAWDEIVDRLGDMGEPVPDTLTPVELARATDPALLSLANRYSAAVYGERRGIAVEEDLITAEWWLHGHFDSGRRLRGAFNPRSLFKGPSA